MNPTGPYMNPKWTPQQAHHCTSIWTPNGHPNEPPNELPNGPSNEPPNKLPNYFPQSSPKFQVLFLIYEMTIQWCHVCTKVFLFIFFSRILCSHLQPSERSLDWKNRPLITVLHCNKVRSDQISFGGFCLKTFRKSAPFQVQINIQEKFWTK